MAPVKSPLRLLVAVGPVVSLGLALATLLLWLRSYEAYPAAALATGGRTWHAGARRGELWLTCAIGWPTPQDARRAARTAVAARPLIVASPLFNHYLQARGGLLEHAAFLRRRLGDRDPEAAAEERIAATIQPLLHEQLVRQAGGPPAVPVIAEHKPDAHARWGFRSERVWARFPLRGDDDQIAYGPRVALAAVAVPCWIPAALFAAWPAALLAGACRRGITARRRQRAGRCRACGYDLRATGDAVGPRLDRCPECGTPATTTATATATVILFLLIAGGRANADDPTTNPIDLPDDPGARALVVANERSLQRLPPFTAVLTLTNPNVQPDPFDVVYRAKGNARYMYGLAVTGRLGQRTQVIVNDAYAAAWQEGAREAYQVELPSGPPVLETSHIEGAYFAAGMLRSDPLNFAYGNTHYPLRRALVESRATEFSASEGTDAGGRRVARLHFKRASGPDPVEWVYELDPERGYAIIHMATFTAKGGSEPVAQMLIDLQPVGDGWIPKRIQRISPHESPGFTKEMQVRVTSVGDVPDAAFRMEALALPEGIYMVRERPPARTQPLMRHDGIWIPMGAVPIRPAATMPVQRPLPKWTWPAAFTAAAAIWLLGIVLMRRRFAAP